MSEQKKKLANRNKTHGRGAVYDVLPKVTEEASPLSRSLDGVLHVKPAPFMTKHAPATSKSLDASQHHFSGKELREFSSNESFATAKSADSETNLEITDVPLENFEPSECMLNPEVTNETLPSYDEDMFQIDTFSDQMEHYCDNELKIVTNIVEDIVQNAIAEESNNLILSQDSLELAAAVSSAATSQAFIETLAEDSDAQIEVLMKIRDEELLTNHCLKNHVYNLEQMNEQNGILVKDLETTYSERCAEIELDHLKKLEIVKLEAVRHQKNLEKELLETKSKLLSAEAEIVARVSVETELNKQITDLTAILREKEKHCKEELQGVIAKLMKAEIISSAKNEVEKEVSEKPPDKESDTESFTWETPTKKSSSKHIQKQKSRLSSLTDFDSKIKELKKLCDDKENELRKLRFEKNELQTELKTIKNELRDSNEKRDSLITLCEENATELKNIRDEAQKSQEASDKLKNELEDYSKEISMERDELRCELKKVVEDIKHRMAAVVDEKDNLLTKHVELEAKLEELRKERDNLVSQNKELSSVFTIEEGRRSSLEAELEKLRRDFMPDPNVSRLSDLPNWSKITDSTQYMEIVPPIPNHVSCQTEDVNRQTSLEQDLESCWTERYEVEQQLATALDEITILRKRAATLESVGLRASGLIDAVPSATVWHQLRGCINEIVTQLDSLCDTENRIVKTGNNQPIPENLFFPIDEIQERSSPEGEQATPAITDNANVEYFDNDHSSRADEISQTQDAAILDQSSSALMVMVEDLIRCLNGEESVCDPNCTFNSSINGSLAERLSTIPDAGELCRVFQQIKEEVTRLFAMSQKTNNPSSAKLQDEINSLQQQVIASDKQVRSTRAFLEEQAAEREIERDEASKRIDEMTEILRSKERQLASKELLEQDTELLEQQLAEAQEEIKTEVEKRQAAEEKLQQTMTKIGNLRDVLEELELQLAEKSHQLEAAQIENQRLQDNLLQSGQRSLEIESAHRDSFTETFAYTARLEEELTSLRYKFEAVGPESLATARNAIKELEAAVARRTRDLELVQVAWRGGHASSASEEISTRDHIDDTRCVTPDEMALEASAGLCEDVERLKERLAKHARVEEAALKKIKDLEQIAVKCEEVQVDYEVAMRRVDSLMTENEKLKTRIEEERHRQLEKVVTIDLEAKIHDLEAQLEAVKEDSMEDRKKLMEKCRREERLEASLKAREVDLSSEAITVKQLKQRLNEEHALRIAAETSLQELSDKENSLTKKSFDDRSLYSSNDSSSFSSKKVRFWTPTSFVGDSLTPIDHNDGSVLRDAESVRDDVITFDNVSHKLPWQSISSVAALQLSPRGNLSSDLHAHSDLSAISPVQLKTIPELSELSALQTKEKRQEEFIKNLENELKACKTKMTRNCKEMELAKKIAEDALARVRLQAETAQKELELRKEELIRVNACLKEVAVEAEVDRERGLQLLNQTQEQLKLVKNQLELQRKETNNLQQLLQDTYKELDSVKTDRDQLTVETQKRDEKISELEYQRHSRRLSFAEYEKLKVEKELLTTQLTIRSQEYESVKLDLESMEEDVNKLKKEKEEIEIRFNSANLKIDELTLKIKDLVDKDNEFKKTVQDIDSMKNQIQMQLTKIEQLKEENEKLRNASYVTENSTFDEDNGIRMEKLHVDAATLRACLKSSLSRTASLEAEVILVRSHLESREGQVASLEAELEAIKSKMESLNPERETDSDSLQVEDADLMMVKFQAQDLALKLEKAKADLARSRTKEARLRTTLEKAVELGRDGATRETKLKKELTIAEREISRLKYLLDTQHVASRGLERLHHHGMAIQKYQFDPRSVRSAGDGEDRQAETSRWTIQRLESYRKALIWQKTYLLSCSCRLETFRRPRKDPKFRTFVLMIIAICRMRYLTRRWKFILPPLTSPPRRERPLMMNSPPCKDPGLRVLHQK